MARENSRPVGFGRLLLDRLDGLEQRVPGAQRGRQQGERVGKLILESFPFPFGDAAP